MTYDLVALVDGRPSSDDVLAGLAAAGEELGVRAVSGGAVVQLCDDENLPLVSIELPLLVQVPGEVERMLGTAVGSVETPVWWVEIRAAARDGARELAEKYAHTLVDRLGGKVWTSGGAEMDQDTMAHSTMAPATTGSGATGSGATGSATTGEGPTGRGATEQSTSEGTD
jgi:hypothetical protein